jgi:hypothetical protein
MPLGTRAYSLRRYEGFERLVDPSQGGMGSHFKVFAFSTLPSLPPGFAGAESFVLPPVDETEEVPAGQSRALRQDVSSEEEAVPVVAEVGPAAQSLGDHSR